VLFVALIMLLVMTLIGVAGMQNSSMEEKMVSNVRDSELSFQAAEAALREAETSLQAAVLKEFDGSNTGLYQPATRDAPPLWEVASTWTSGGSLSYTGSLAYTSAQPRYIIEELPAVPDPEGSIAADEPLPETRVYRVTARGVGGTDKAITILQAAFKR
jgi:type IV pilus assembly protein PilX